MARFIDCPNNGKCGFGRHILGSDSYNKCLKAASGFSVKSAGNVVNVSSTTPPVASPRPRTREEMLETFDRLWDSESYQLPHRYVGDMTFGDDEIQGIINVGSASPMKAESEQYFKSRIKGNLKDIAQEPGFEEVGENLDALADMVFDEEKTFTILSIAENHREPRLFTRKCEPSTWLGSKKDAYSRKEVGSDDWFGLLAAMYKEDLNIEYDSDPYSNEERIQDNQAIVSALRDAIRDDVDKIDDDYVYPDIQVVWSGKLHDAIPYAHTSQDVLVKTPSFFFTRNGEILTDPVRLLGNHKIDMPSAEDRERGERLTGIKDDMTSKTPLFDHSDIGRYASSVSHKPTW